MADTKAKSPEPVPDPYKQGVETLEQGARTVYDTYGVPYFIQKAMADDGYTTLQDLADRWDTPEKAREQAPEALQFKDTQNHYSKSESDFVAMRMMQAVRRASQLATIQGAQVPGQIGKQFDTSGMQVLVMQNKRATLEAQWRRSPAVPVPKLDEQGSDEMIKKQWNYCESVTIGTFEIKQICSALPDPKTMQTPKKKRRSTDGVITE